MKEVTLVEDYGFADWSEESKYAAWSRYAEKLSATGDIPVPYVHWCERYEV